MQYIAVFLGWFIFSLGVLCFYNMFRTNKKNRDFTFLVIGVFCMACASIIFISLLLLNEKI